MSSSSLLKTYYTLAKPGIIYGNAVTAIGGFFLASKGHFNLGIFVSMLLGISFIIASGCVFNNYLDRDIDKLMGRTKNRALVTGAISVRNALVYGTLLGLIGALFLGLFTNLLTLGIGGFGWVSYVIIYGIWKRRSVHGTLVGSVAGAIPIVVGYCAVSNRFDLGALLLFLILALWQMPHFYAIAMYRLNDYKAASIPVLPAVKGMLTTKIYTLLYIDVFIIAVALLSILGYTGYTYAISMVLLGLTWFWIGMRGFKADSDVVWGRKVFRFSLVVITALSVMISVGAVLP